MDQRNNNLVFEELSHSLPQIVNTYLVSLAHQPIPAAMWIHVASFAMCAVEIKAKKTGAIIIFNLLRNPGIDSKKSISPAYVTLRAGTTTLFLLGS
jgi:hypothetical protein